jgi:hypothetical protein
MTGEVITINLGPKIACARCGTEFHSLYGCKTMFAEGTFCSSGCAEVASMQGRDRAINELLEDYFSERKPDRMPTGWWIGATLIAAIVAGAIALIAGIAA